MQVRKGIIEFMGMVGEVYDDLLWWEDWQMCYDEGNMYWGWGEVVDNRDEYKRRMEIILRYMKWLQENSFSGALPKWVSDTNVEAYAR